MVLAQGQVSANSAPYIIFSLTVVIGVVGFLLKSYLTNVRDDILNLAKLMNDFADKFGSLDKRVLLLESWKNLHDILHPHPYGRPGGHRSYDPPLDEDERSGH